MSEHESRGVPRLHDWLLKTLICKGLEVSPRAGLVASPRRQLRYTSCCSKARRRVFSSLLPCFWRCMALRGVSQVLAFWTRRDSG
jgi:hypothetical protein